MCKEPCSIQKPECDHRVPLQEGGGNQRNSWDLLCRPCHAIKTGDEAFRGKAHPGRIMEALSRGLPASKRVDEASLAFGIKNGNAANVLKLAQGVF
jgi:hypothetical protein